VTFSLPQKILLSATLVWLAVYVGMLRHALPDCGKLDPESVEMILCQEEGMASAVIDIFVVGASVLISGVVMFVFELRK
jgi:hypothetical protein